MLRDTKGTKNTVIHQCFLHFWDLRTKKAARKSLVKSTPVVIFINILQAAFTMIFFSQKNY